VERSDSGVTGTSPRGWNRLIPPALREPRRLALFAVAAVLAAAGVGRGVEALRASSRAVMPGVSVSHRITANPPMSPEAIAAGIETRDRIRALDGRPVVDAGALIRELEALGPGVAVVLDMEGDGGRRYRAPVITAESPIATTASSVAVGAVYLLAALVALWLGAGRREAWLFAIACQVLGLGLMLLAAEPPAAMPIASARVGFLFWALAGPAMLHFIAAFPRPVPFLARHPRLPPLAMIGAGLIAAIAAARFGPGSEDHRLPVAMIAAVNALCAGLAIAILRWRLRRPQPARDAARLRLLIAAIILAFTVPATTTVLRVLGVWIPPIEIRAALTAVLAIFPLLVAYAVIAHNLLDLDRAVIKAAAYSGALVAVGGLYVAAVVLVPGKLAPAALASSPTAIAVAVVAAMAALWPVKRGLEQAATRLFHRPELDAGVDEVRSLIADAARDRGAEVFARLERRIERVFRATPVEIHLRQDSRWRRPATGDTETAAPESPLAFPIGDGERGLLAIGHPGDRLALPGGEREALAAIAGELGSALAGSREGDRIGRYKVVRFLASGGMGNVYLATREGAGGFSKTVALKRLLPEAALEPETVDRFVTEARVVARLTHPNIVATYELEETEGGYTIAMEHVDGVDAARLLRWLGGRGETLPLALAANVATQVCLALDHAHAATDRDGAPMRLIHRDVTPHNVLLSRDGAVKLADFGVAHVKGRPSERGRLIGKTAYLAPEQLRGEPLDHRVDVFAAGLLLYELVTGEHPFRHAGRAETWEAIERGRFLPITMLRGDAPEALARLAARALSADPGERPSTAREMAEALEALYPLESRNAVELGAIVRAAAGLDEPPPRGTTETIRARPAGNG
jgi:hypothetical protein